MTSNLLPKAGSGAVAITGLSEGEFAQWRKAQSPLVANQLKLHDFAAKPGSSCLLLNAKGELEQVVAGLSSPISPWDIAALADRLPEGTYRLAGKLSAGDEEKLALGWLLQGYRFGRYKKQTPPKAQLALAHGADYNRIVAMAAAVMTARDLINTPAEDLGPAELAAAAVAIAKSHKAKISQIVGDDLLAQNFPAIHRVGRAASQAPRLIDLQWGQAKHPKVTLVGKGVCFDTGGLDIKPSSGMYLMKKDMGGAAVALGLAQLIMTLKLPVRLRVLIPAVENAISGNAYRPSDVITMRNGKTVEVGNTDAEGRLILADCLTLASAEQPDLLIDFSTLTGAARTAVGTEISALFSNNDALAEGLAKAGATVDDPIWRLPLHASYNRMLDSRIADLNSAPNSPYAGAITAALFMQHFVGHNIPWAHFDFMAWNLASKPGRPEGGEAMALRSVFAYLEERFSA